MGPDKVAVRAGMEVGMDHGGPAGVRRVSGGQPCTAVGAQGGQPRGRRGSTAVAQFGMRRAAWCWVSDPEG